MLLRADIHTLFDLGMITVTADGKLQVSEMLKETDYANYHGVPLRLPASATDQPSELALAWHRTTHGNE